MGHIIILDENTANQIAAGEVIERPASVVKELIENSLDAGADSIKIEISRGGIALIKITDNGTGISAEDVEMAFERHGTSKIRSAADLEEVGTMGFRGEALPSIASVSKIELNTREKLAKFGVRVKITGGKIDIKQKSTRKQGTTVTVKNLFFNTPARYKFLKNDTTEARYCTDIISRLALAHTKVSFSYYSNGSELLRTPGDGNLKSAVYCIYGRDISENLFEVDYDDGTYRITGFIGSRLTARGNRKYQSLFVNKRYVKSREVIAAVERAYETEIMKGKFPFFILNLVLDTRQVDVNVHPAKAEIRFEKGSEIFSAVHSAVKTAINEGRGVTNGGVGQVRSKKEIFYKAVEEKPLNASFLSDIKTSDYMDGKIIKKIIEDTSEAKEEFYNRVIPIDRDEDKYEKKEKYTRENIVGIEILNNSKFIGILFKTFIMMEINSEEVLLIDQHAAHERITYESLLKKFTKRDMKSQLLMIPVAVRVDSSEAAAIENNADILKELGFEFDFIGDRDIAIRSIPAEITEKDTSGVFLGAVEAISTNIGAEQMLMEKEAIYKMACNSSVKANTELNDIEVSALLDKLRYLDNPYTCPHGRPVIVKLNRRELEKIFKRIV